MKESALVRAIIKSVKEKYPNAYIRKISDRHRRGVPDILIIIPRWPTVTHDLYAESITLLVEAKTIYGKVGALQMVEANAIKMAGGHHIFATSKEEVLNELEAMGAISL